MTATPKFEHFAEFQIAYFRWLDLADRTEYQHEIFDWLKDEHSLLFENVLSCLQHGNSVQAAHYLQLAWDVARHQWAEDKASREVAAPMDPDDVTTWNSKYVDEL